MKKRHVFTTLLSALLLGSLAGAADATTWTGKKPNCGQPDTRPCGDGKSWGDEHNWEPEEVPGGGSTATLPFGTVILKESISLKSLELVGGSVSNGGPAGTTISIEAGGGVSLMEGSVTVGLSLPEMASLDISGDKGKALGGTVDNRGTINWTGPGAVGGGGLILNSGVLALHTDGVLYPSAGAGPAIANTGLITKVGGTGVTAIGRRGQFTNDGGILKAETGTLEFSGLAVNDTFRNGAFRGPGRVRLLPAAPFFGAAGATFEGTIMLEAGATLEFAGGSPYMGTFTFAGAGRLEWSAGTLSGAGYDVPTALTIAPGVTLDFVGTGAKALGGTVINQGTINWKDTGVIGGGGTFVNQGAMNVSFDGVLGDPSFPGPTFDNRGLLRKTGGTGETKTGRDLFLNSGTVEVQTGAFVVGGGAKFTSGATFNGPGKVQLHAPADVSGTITLNGPFEMDSTGSKLQGIATLDGPGTLDWIVGALGDPFVASEITLGPNLTTEMSAVGDKTISGTLTNRGTIHWSGSPIGGGGTLVNAGTINLLADGVFGSPSNIGPNFDNRGLMRKTGGTGTTRVGRDDFTSSGTIEVRTGVFQTNWGSEYTSGATFTGPGKFALHAPANMSGAITLNGPFEMAPSAVLSGSATLNGTGTLEWTGGFIGSSVNAVGEAFTFGPGLTVNASGEDKYAHAPVTNQGTLNFKGGKPIVINTDFTNAGTVNFQAAGKGLNVGTGHFTNTGTINTFAEGVTKMEYTPDQFTNAGALNVGGNGGIGTLEIWGATQTPAGGVNIDIAPPTETGQPRFDRIQVSPTQLDYPFNLDGTLNVHLLDSYLPPGNTVYHVITGTVKGAFAAVNDADATVGVTLVPTYQPKEVDLAVACGVAGKNDNVADAQPLTGRTGAACGDSTAATEEFPFLGQPGRAEPLYGGRHGAKSIWYRWTAPYDGDVQFSTLGSGFDTLLAAYSSGPELKYDDFLTVAGNDDSDSAFVTSPVDFEHNFSLVHFPAEAGRTYYLAVAGYNGQGGPARLTWIMAPQAAPSTETRQTLTGFSPAAARLGGVDANGFLELTLTGTGFTSDSRLYVNGRSLTGGSTNFVSPTEVHAFLDESYLAEARELILQVGTPTGAGQTYLTNRGHLWVVNYVVVRVSEGTPAAGGTVGKRGSKPVFSIQAVGEDPGQPFLFSPATYEEDLLFNQEHRDAAEAYDRIVGQLASLNPAGATGASKIDVTLSVPATDVPAAVLAPLDPGQALPPGTRVLSTDGHSLITNDGGSLITNDGGSLITNDGGGLITNDGGSLITNDGGSLITNDGGGLITNDGGSLITNDGGSFTGGGPSPQQAPPPPAWRVVRGTGGKLPTVENAVDAETGIPVGTVSVTFDGTSIPKVTELNGKVFAVAVPKYGDVNGDGSTDVSDAILGLQAIVGLATLDELQTLNADLAPVPGAGLNAGAAFGDGNLDVSDVIRLLRRIVGLEPDPFP